MASSGVWENVNALQDTHFWWCLWNIILYNISLPHLFAILVPTCWHICQYVSLMADDIANFFNVGCDRCYSHCSSWKLLGCYSGRYFLLMWLIMATLWDGWWCCHCGRWNSQIFVMTDLTVIVAAGIATLWDNWWCCNCGRWNSHFMWMADVICHCGRWNCYIIDWLML